ncbi:hypothetical protein [Sporosarcina sp. FSL K6-2383]|uniref:hypothetical protein n=1 Tax=Sporosarcina sp. FSL K6-2383 TaxID=2921556 RepID=UPI00315AEFBE
MSKVMVTFTLNVKYGTELYSRGDSASVSADDCDELLALGVIEDDFVRPVKKKQKAESKEE